MLLYTFHKHFKGWKSCPGVKVLTPYWQKGYGIGIVPGWVLRVSHATLCVGASGMSTPTGRNVTLLLAETKFRPRFELGSPSPHVWMWELEYKESWAPKNWCFLTVVLEKILESPLDCKEIQPVHPKGDQSWIFIGRTDVEAETPILCPLDVKSWLIWKGPHARKNWKWEKKGTTKVEMIGWHNQLNGHEFE